MRRAFSILIMLSCFLIMSYYLCLAKEERVGILLLIAEQNIEGPQRAWWASEVDLSTVEAEIAKYLIVHSYKILHPSQLTGILHREKAFRRVSISDEESIRLAKLSRADYIILGKAIASAGNSVPGSNMRSCFANITAKIIRVRDGEIIAYLQSQGKSVHMDVITGGREALVKSARELATRIEDSLEKEFLKIKSM